MKEYGSIEKYLSLSACCSPSSSSRKEVVSYTCHKNRRLPEVGFSIISGSISGSKPFQQAAWSWSEGDSGFGLPKSSFSQHCRAAKLVPVSSNISCWVEF